MKHLPVGILLLTCTATCYGYSLQIPAGKGLGKFAQQFSTPSHEGIAHAAGATEYLDGVLWNDLPAFKMAKKWGNKCKGIRVDARTNVICYGGFLIDAANESQYRKIGQDYILPYRSHFGDLQFLHAMASVSEEPAVDTQKKMTDWARFAYQVATGEISPSTRLSKVDSELIRADFNRKVGWDVRYLFTAHDPASKVPDSTVRQIAFGSILHMVQDSFSSSHTCRVQEGSSQCSLDNHGDAIKAFYAYTTQDTHAHSIRDKLTTIETMDRTKLDNPVGATKALTNLLKDKVDTDTFMVTFSKIVALSQPTDNAYAGKGLERRINRIDVSSK